MAIKSELRKDFDKEAAQWDANSTRVKLANDVATAIIREANLTEQMEVLDFGCGTGLLTLKLQPYVKSITGVDSSDGMLGILQEKIGSHALNNVYTQHVNPEMGKRIVGAYNLIVSSMTLHHVPNTVKLFKECFSLLLPNGKVCFADLDIEDGSFHGDNTGVFHLGFDRDNLKQILHEAGFVDIRDTTATTVFKEIAEQGEKQYPVFLIIATRKSVQE